MRIACATLAAVALAACVETPPPASPYTPPPPSPVVEYVNEQQILAPLPVRVRLPDHYGAEKVLVFYNMWGTEDWKTLELSRAGQTWTGEVSCREVSTVTGDTRYYFVAVDANGDEVVGSGWPEWPHVATIVHSLPEGPQGLPGTRAPRACHDPADCPPDFPGCPAYKVRRPACHVDDDCGKSGVCGWDGYCDAAPATASQSSEESDEERLAAAVRKHTHRAKVVAAMSKRDPR